ncbi:MAG: D-glycero-beta-D-manno-heptose 1,7-bisphosphate 7-phosphatase [Gammaproteobacteria bacterium]|nr:D-glycero-beta-D-manno-heptose 1,7-bisphosphate 7-phosphatase [Gammaproteobacteria bacterium]
MKLVILDRDGVINQDSDQFIKSPDEWIPIPGSLEAIGRLNREGWRVVIATNQSGIARNLFNMDMLNRIHDKMVQMVAGKGGEVDGIFFCPHGPGDACRCRKPRPGLFEDIAERFRIQLNDVFAVGDSERDIVAARDAKARPVLVKTGKGRSTAKTSTELDGVPVFRDLAEFVDTLVQGKLEEY